MHHPFKKYEVNKHNFGDHLVFFGNQICYANGGSNPIKSLMFMPVITISRAISSEIT